MSDYYSAAIPEPFTICKLRLKPYSLGHIILLHRVDSAFVTGGDAGLEDLITSVFLCSQSYEDGVKALDNPKLPKFMKSWQRQLGSFNVKAKMADFAAYIEAHSKSPLFKFEVGKTKANHCPVAQLVKMALLSETNLTETEILNRSWSLCLWDFVTLRTMAGKVDMMNPTAINDAQAIADKLQAKFNTRTPVCPSE